MAIIAMKCSSSLHDNQLGALVFRIICFYSVSDEYSEAPQELRVSFLCQRISDPFQQLFEIVHFFEYGTNKPRLKLHCLKDWAPFLQVHVYSSMQRSPQQSRCLFCSLCLPLYGISCKFWIDERDIPVLLRVLSCFVG